MRALLRYCLVVAITSDARGHVQPDDSRAKTSHDVESGGLVQASETSASIGLGTATLYGNGTCPSRTANYITHTLPQQCLRTDRISVNATQAVVSIETVGTNATATAQESPATTSVQTEVVSGSENDITASGEALNGPSHTVQLRPSGSIQPAETLSAADTSRTASSTSIAGGEAESDSPLDNAKFLSFEEWKKQNLAKPAEQGRDIREHVERQRPGINNALDGFGEDGEIDLDFSGFGTPENGPRQQRNAYRSRGEAAAGGTPLAPQTSRSKDAGKTCKERTNYASFDCAATVLKTNPECKSASSVLVENKDSYMLNTCSAENKFFIVELCDHSILVDTVVLANYEFFSSIFRHFRVSASGTYPVEMDKWIDLGTYEARNTREVQAFLIEHPQIWARYLRIEFLTHYGSEYYCPVSLLRVHGKTMLEELREQVETSHGDASNDIAASVVAQESATSADKHTEDTAQAVSTSSEMVEVTEEVAQLHEHANATGATEVEGVPSRSSYNVTDVIPVLVTSNTEDFMCPSPSSSGIIQSSQTSTSAGTEGGAYSPSKTGHSHLPADTSPAQSLSATSTDSTMLHGTSSTDPPPQYHNDTTMTSTASSMPDVATHRAPEHESFNTTGVKTQSSESVANASSGTHSNNTSRTASATASAPAQPQPSTQESFFKSIHKRLQQLESNSTLSLQYIEEQSRILRDAFSKVEKRQISATTNFLTNLNETVMQELHGFRQAYDQLWQSTVLELEGQREQYQREMLALSSRLTLVADELVWQKRMGIVQSTLLLLCLGLVLFARGGNTNGYLEVPLMQQMMNKSTAALGRPGWESPPASPSPENRSPVSVFRRRLWRSITEPSVGTSGALSGTDSRPESKDGPMVVDVNVEPPTPPSAASTSSRDTWNDADDEDDILDP